MVFMLHLIAGTFAASQAEVAAIIQGAAEAYLAESLNYVRPISLIITEALGEERARTPRPRCRHGLGSSCRLHPYPGHPSPQRTPIRDPTMSEFGAIRAGVVATTAAISTGAPH